MQHGGKEMLYLNVYDVEVAWWLVHCFDGFVVVVVKHVNFCGVGLVEDLIEVYWLVYGCDLVSAFGGIVVVNGCVLFVFVEVLVPVFIEVVVVFGYDDDALAVLTAKKNFCVLLVFVFGVDLFEVCLVDGGFLV